jgi:hypothetical protein
MTARHVDDNLLTCHAAYVVEMDGFFLTSKKHEM